MTKQGTDIGLLLDTIFEKESAQPGSADIMLDSLKAQMGLDLRTEWEKALRQKTFGLIGLDQVEEKAVSWLVPELIPRKAITLLGGDGGSGKGMISAGIAAAVSTGKKCFFEARPEEFRNDPERVLIFSSEDSLEVVLRRRLRLAGADLRNVFSVPMQDERFSEIRFDGEALKRTIAEVKPSLVIFDPLQSFLSERIRMSERNAMRQALNPLLGICEKDNVSALLMMHTNKGRGNAGRKRLADSADVWDIARSVMIVGHTQERSIRYLSHEKSNYGALQKTVLFSINNEGTAVFEGYSDKKDCDYVRAQDAFSYQQPLRDDATEFIKDFLKNGKRPTKELDEAAAGAGISKATLARAKTELRQTGTLGFQSEGYGATKVFYSYLIAK